MGNMHLNRSMGNYVPKISRAHPRLLTYACRCRKIYQAGLYSRGVDGAYIFDILNIDWTLVACFAMLETPIMRSTSSAQSFCESVLRGNPEEAQSELLFATAVHSPLISDQFDAPPLRSE